MSSQLNSPLIPESCWPNEKQTLLLKAALMDGNDARDSFMQWISGMNIDTLEYASYRMIPLLYSNLSQQGIQHKEMNRLKGIARYHWMKNRMVMHLVPGILSAMSKADIQTVILKGTALIERYYIDASRRPMNDIDILVPYDDALHAAEVLVANGWTPLYQNDFEALRQHPERRVRNGICFINDKKVECDLHWAVLHDSTWRGADDSFWRDAVPVTYVGQLTHMLSPTHQLLHTCLHGGRFNEFHPMRWIGDAIYILRKDGGDIDWNECILQGQKHHMLLVLKAALNLLVNEYKASIPDDVIQLINKAKPSHIETARYKLITERTTTLSGLIRRDWYQHCSSSPHLSPFRHVITFPVYIKDLWRINSWWRLPGHAWSRLLYRIGFKSDTSQVRGD